MTNPETGGTPPDAEEYNFPEQEQTAEAAESLGSANMPVQEAAGHDVDVTNLETIKAGAAKPEEAIARIEPKQKTGRIPIDSIETVRIGLAHNVGHIEGPTRVVIIMKDGRSIDMPWEKAETMLPPIFKTCRELGDEANRLASYGLSIARSIRVGANFRGTKERLKSFLLKPFGKDTAALEYLTKVEDLVYEEIDKIAKTAFITMRGIMNSEVARQQEGWSEKTMEDHEREIEELRAQLADCKQRLEALTESSFSEIPKAQEAFEKWYDRRTPEEKGIPEQE